eukprot:9494754-Pyramimonas_sp.AAC.1
MQAALYKKGASSSQQTFICPNSLRDTTSLHRVGPVQAIRHNYAPLSFAANSRPFAAKIRGRI